MKKVLSLVLAVALVVGMSATAFAAVIHNGGLLTGLDAGQVSLGISDPAPTGTVLPDTTVTYKIYYGANDDYLTRSQIRNMKIDVQIRATEGGAAIDSAKVVYKNLLGGTAEKVAVVEVKFAKEFVSTKDLDFSIDIYLTEKKARLADTKESLDGVFGNEVTYVSEGDDYVYIGDTHVVEAEDYIRSIQVDLGQGVSIYTKMFADKKYYGSVSQEIKTEDEAILAQYPDIETIYYLKTLNLNATGETVEFDLESNFYAYVQDEEGNISYLGRTNDRLPYYTKYFLSSKELDVDTIEIGDGDDIVEPGEDGPITGGDDAPANVNDNPSTGR